MAAASGVESVASVRAAARASSARRAPAGMSASLCGSDPAPSDRATSVRTTGGAPARQMSSAPRTEATSRGDSGCGDSANRIRQGSLPPAGTRAPAGPPSRTRNRVLDAIRAAKHVTVHVVSVRHRRRRRRVQLCVDEGAIDAVDVFARVRHVVMDGEVLRRPREGPLVKSQRRASPTHSVPIGRRILRLPDEQQKLDVPRIFCQDLIEPLLVRRCDAIHRRDGPRHRADSPAARREAIRVR